MLIAQFSFNLLRENDALRASSVPVYQAVAADQAFTDQQRTAILKIMDDQQKKSQPSEVRVVSVATVTPTSQQSSTNQFSGMMPQLSGCTINQVSTYPVLTAADFWDWSYVTADKCFEAHLRSGSPATFWSSSFATMKFDNLL